jgi:hypothetical protein
MWRNTVVIHNVLKKKITKLKIKLKNTILNKKTKKNHVGKRGSNPRCFVRKASTVILN